MIYEKYIIFDHKYQNIYMNFNYGKIFRKKGKNWEEVKGNDNRKGYLIVRYKGKMVSKHRFLYENYYGIEIPEELQVDHINRNKSDNRIINLRLVSKSQNNQNKDISNHSSKYPWIHWDKSHKKWRSEIKLKGKMKFLGYFNTDKNAYLFARNIAKTLNLYGANINIPIDQEDIDLFLYSLFE